MATDPKRIELHLDAFESQTNRSHLIEFTVFEDRLEVVVDSNAGSSAIRLSRHVASQR